MMENTVESGTSYRSFHDKAGKPYLPDIRVAGKTGTLTKPRPRGPVLYLVRGLRPEPQARSGHLGARGQPRQVAAKANHVACDMLRVYFADKGAPGVKDPSERDTSARR